MRDIENVKSLVHRTLAQHAPLEICEECPPRDRVLVQLTAKMGGENAEKILAPILEAVDLCWKATPYGTTDDGDTASYILPKGAVHRLVGALQGIGVSASLRAMPDGTES